MPWESSKPHAMNCINIFRKKGEQCGGVGHVPTGGFHYVQNIGQDKLFFLEFFRNDHFSDLSLAQWVALTPREIAKSCLNLPDAFFNHVRKESCSVVRYPGCAFPPANYTPQNVRYFSRISTIKSMAVHPAPATRSNCCGGRETAKRWRGHASAFA